ncbi:FecR domain-containing protein [uncultured Hyphomicrobium sp.]|uniref:FecR family protein n=1 Tax=uncultured Hyphomicrobium sp. TaxID=194373 RepID=UPI0025FCA932|nr:FecR domain-containing protein [uncultured Hyphomicrobium sp.]
MKIPSPLMGIFVFLASASHVEAAQQPIGSALVVVNLVTAAFNRDTRTLQKGDRVHQDEQIEVGSDASSEFKFDDETKLALGPGSHLKLDKFVYDPAKSNGSIVLDLVKGTFRFMTGVAEKPTYVIKTPAAAITVRGTIFDVFVQDTESWLLLHEGAIRVCNVRGTQCKDLTEPGKLIRITSGGDVGSPVKWASLSGKDNVPFDNAFPFVAKTPSIDPTPILTRDIIILGTLPEVDNPKGNDEDVDNPKRRTETTKPPKKKRAEKKDDDEDKPKIKKKKRQAKKDDDDDAKRAVGTAIGIGIGIGIGRHRGHDHGGSRGGMDGGRSMGGRGK